MEKIRDYDGRSVRRAQQIQSVVGALGQITARPVMPEVLPTEVGQDPPTIGWDRNGEYHCE
jgi:hypothetical protein